MFIKRKFSGSIKLLKSSQNHFDIQNSTFNIFDSSHASVSSLCALKLVRNFSCGIVNSIYIAQIIIISKKILNYTYSIIIIVINTTRSNIFIPFETLNEVTLFQLFNGSYKVLNCDFFGKIFSKLVRYSQFDTLNSGVAGL